MKPLRAPFTQDYTLAAGTEWYESDGVGGISGASVLGVNTRKQHGLLSICDDREGRQILLASLQETVVDGGKAYDLSTSTYLGAVHPAGYQHLESFSIDPWPTWRYRFDTFCLVRQFFLVAGEHTAVISYEISGTRRLFTLTVRPMLAFRHHNAVRAEGRFVPRNWHVSGEFAECNPFPNCPALYIAHPSADAETVPLWYRSFLYERDRESHVDCVEDLFSPGALRLPLAPGDATTLVVSSPSPRSIATASHYTRAENLRRRKRATLARKDEFAAVLLRAAECYAYEAPDLCVRVRAGIPWGEPEPARELLALPGLMLPAGRLDQAEKVLSRAARAFTEEMPQCSQPTPDAHEGILGGNACLWFALAAWRVWKAGTADSFARDLLAPALSRSLANLMRGEGAWRVRDGLLAARHPDVIDASPVFLLGENALWYNALVTLAELLESAGDDEARGWREHANIARSSFAKVFALRPSGVPPSAVAADGSWSDASIRADQVLVAGLPFVPLESLATVLAAVEEHLGTPFGPRTLSPRDSRYTGDGTDVALLPRFWSGSVDPALFGLYCDARRRAGQKPCTIETFAPFRQELVHRGYGHISGAFAGDPPHAGTDCAGSACALAEVTRIYARDVLGMAGIT